MAEAMKYGKEEFAVTLPAEKIAAELEPNRVELPQRTVAEHIRYALAHPVDSAPLDQLVHAGETVCIVISDVTRRWQSPETYLPILIEELEKAGIRDEDMLILSATGTHRRQTREEHVGMVTEAVYDRIRVVDHQCEDTENLTYVGTTSFGTPVWLDKRALECDHIILTGGVVYHFMAGFGGGRKSILPGICSQETVNENHSYKAISSPYANTGVLEHNPIHEDMLAAAKMVNVQFIFNVALDGQKKIIAAWAGDLEKAHAEGVAFIRKWSQCPSITGDIVVTSNGGYPLDQNLYQSPKAVATAEACAGEDGVIIMCCSCADGMGGTHFEKLITMGTVDEIDGYLSKIPPKETIPEQWCPQIYARILKKHPVILVTTYLKPEEVRKANMIPASTPDEALEIAYQMKGRDASVVVIPDGVSVLAVKE